MLREHAALLASLREGMIHVRPHDAQTLVMYVSGGYVEVQPERVMVLADLAERDPDLDAACAAAARDRTRSYHFPTSEAWQTFVAATSRERERQRTALAALASCLPSPVCRQHLCGSVAPTRCRSPTAYRYRYAINYRM